MTDTKMTIEGAKLSEAIQKSDRSSTRIAGYARIEKQVLALPLLQRATLRDAIIASINTEVADLETRTADAKKLVN